ncbi:MAG: hypothetical protein M3P41_06230 [Actinomycetota bacterium]|nr:hypothetical protein [Actinomycetota bacterium]
MFGRSSTARGVVAGAAETASPYVDRLANDEKLRRRLVAGLAAGLAARERARQQAGLVGGARRLASDPVLRAHLAELALQLRKAQGQVKQVKRNRSHKVRNTLLFASGVGMIFAAAPSLRAALVSKVRSGNEWAAEAWAGGDGNAPDEVVDEGAPITS